MHWIPIKDAIPHTKDNREYVKVLVTCKPEPINAGVNTTKYTKVIPADYDFRTHNFEQYVFGGIIEGVTAWMYFPEKYLEEDEINEVE